MRLQKLWLSMRRLRRTLHFHGQTNLRQRRPVWFLRRFRITKRRKRPRNWMQGFGNWWTNRMSFYSWREALTCHVVGFLGKLVHYSKKRISNSAILISWLTRVWGRVCIVSIFVPEILLLVLSYVILGLKVLNEWPTFPQLIVKGELVGGLDIVQEMAESGELAELVA